MGIPVMVAGVVLSLPGKRTVWQQFLPDDNDLAMSASTASSRAVESRTGALALGLGGCSGAVAPGLGPAPMTAFPVPSLQTGLPASGVRMRSCLRMRKDPGPRRQAGEVEFVAQPRAGSAMIGR